MLKMFSTASMSSGRASLAAAFSRLGWIGFWLQLALVAIPLALMIYALIVGRSTAPGTRSGLPLVEYLTIASVLLLAFTTIWFYRYTRLAKQLADPQRDVPRQTVQQTAWIGVAAGSLGLVFSMLIMLAEVTTLLFYFLRAPQAGVPVIQTTQATGGGPASWVSTADVLSLLALVLTMFGELIVLIFSLWLLFRAFIVTAEFADGGDTELAHSGDTRG